MLLPPQPRSTARPRTTRERGVRCVGPPSVIAASKGFAQKHLEGLRLRASDDDRGGACTRYFRVNPAWAVWRRILCSSRVATCVAEVASMLWLWSKLRWPTRLRRLVSPPAPPGVCLAHLWPDPSRLAATGILQGAQARHAEQRQDHHLSCYIECGIEHHGVQATPCDRLLASQANLKHACYRALFQRYAHRFRGIGLTSVG